MTTKAEEIICKFNKDISIVFNELFQLVETPPEINYPDDLIRIKDYTGYKWRTTDPDANNNTHLLFERKKHNDPFITSFEIYKIYNGKDITIIEINEDNDEDNPFPFYLETYFILSTNLRIVIPLLPSPKKPKVSQILTKFEKNINSECKNLFNLFDIDIGNKTNIMIDKYIDLNWKRSILYDNVYRIHLYNNEDNVYEPLIEVVWQGFENIENDLICFPLCIGNLSECNHFMFLSISKEVKKDDNNI